MAFSIGRIARVALLSIGCAAVGLAVLRQKLPADEPKDIGVIEAPADPALQNLRLRVTMNGKQGFIDGCGQVVIQPAFDMALPFSEGLAAVAVVTDGTAGREFTWRFVQASGDVAFPQSFTGTRIGTFREGRAPILINGKWGYINNNGQFVIQPQYDTADDFSEGLAAYQTGRLYGVVDRDGAVVLPAKYAFIGSYKEGRALFAEGGKFGYLNRKGVVAVPAQFAEANDFSEGLAYVSNQIDTSGKIGGYINTSGEYQIPPRSFQGGPFRQGLAAVHGDGSPYYIDRTGKTALQVPGVQGLGNFAEGRASFVVSGRNGFIDLNGTVVISPQWEFVSDFVGGVARVSHGSLRGYINSSGQFVWKRLPQP